ncbi:ABATE domain-containing protein [Streptomyces sp. NPDC006393]|uniref:transcriptional regulator, SarA/Rot family n=1 Tax=Streptomyces sp. NPDC006393 TaxID=3156763 RepID=UPI0033EB736E
MVTGREQQDMVLELLNTTPVVDGTVQDQLADPEAARSWQRAHGGSGSTEEHQHLLQARDALQDVVRGSRPATALSPLLKELNLLSKKRSVHDERTVIVFVTKEQKDKIKQLIDELEQYI